MAFFTQRILNSPPGGNPQTPVGAVDGTNKVFTVTNPLNNLYLNQGFQTPGGVDYTSTKSGSTVTITFIVAPPTGSTLFAT